MSIIRRLKNNIDELNSLISKLKEEEESVSSDDFAFSMKKNALKSQLEDLQHKLYLENVKREKEIIKIRLVGPKANFGNLPLDFVGGITTNVSSSLFNTSKYLQFGRKGGKKKEKLINDTINLRFEGVGRGSTIFYISGDTSPDLFGISLLQNSLENTFDFMNSSSPDEVSENISKVGNKSLKFIAKFLNELVKDDLECEFRWDSPEDKEFLWDGKHENILKLSNTLNKLEISDPEKLEFEGELITISAKGRFEISTIENRTLYGTFSNELLPKMEEFHIKEACKGVITKTTIYNPITDKEKIEYELIKIE